MATSRTRSGLQTQAGTTFASASSITASSVKTYEEDVAESTSNLTDNNTHTGVDTFKDLRVSDSGELTIASGVITPTGSRHNVDTESDAASDDLDTITATSRDGMILILSANNAARTVTAKDGTGNLVLAGDFAMDNTEDRLVLQCDGTNWYELSRSNNGA